MKRFLAVLVAVACACLGTAAAQDKGAKAPSADAKRGRYLVQIAGCNDCHTPGYMANAGKVDEKVWLTGEQLGWSGPWGTTYAVNLRLYMKDMTEADWVHAARHMKARPPMPWFTFEAMSDRDLRAIYQFVKTLGAVGEPAPAYLPPGVEPKGPVARFQ